jgi:hypothetical protein
MSKSRINETANHKNAEKKEQFGIKDYRVWKQKSGLLNDNIMEAIVKSQSQVKNYTEALNDGERHDRKRIKSYQSTDNYKNKKKDEIQVSDNVKKIMGDVGKLVMNIRIQEDNLSKVNINALLETTNQIKKSEIISEPNSILRIKEKEYKLALEGKLKKPPNYKFLSDSYRKQVNKAFNDYNPIIHLGNIHMLRKTDPEIDKQFKLQIKEIDEETKTAKGFLFYKNEKNKKKGKSEKKGDLSNEKRNSTFNNFLNTKNIGFTTCTLPTTATATVTDGMNAMKNSSNKVNMFGKKLKHKKQEIKRKFPDKENREIELNLMKNVCEQLETTVSPYSVGNYFKNYKILKNTDLPQQKHTFFGNIDNAQKILTEIQENMHIKKMEEDIRNRKKHTSMESEKLVNKINELKLSILSEIDEQEKKQNKIYNK